jgi:hypothetical protein
VGMDDFLSKPIDVNSLFKVVEKWTERKYDIVIE